MLGFFNILRERTRFFFGVSRQLTRFFFRGVRQFVSFFFRDAGERTRFFVRQRGGILRRRFDVLRQFLSLARHGGFGVFLDQFDLACQSTRRRNRFFFGKAGRLFKPRDHAALGLFGALRHRAHTLGGHLCRCFPRRLIGRLRRRLLDRRQTLGNGRLELLRDLPLQLLVDLANAAAQSPAQQFSHHRSHDRGKLADGWIKPLR